MPAEPRRRAAKTTHRLSSASTTYDEYERNREGWLIGKDAEFERLWLRRKGKEYLLGKSRREKEVVDGDSRAAAGRSRSA